MERESGGEGGIRPRYVSVMPIGDERKRGARPACPPLVKNAINEARMKTSLTKWVRVQAHVRILKQIMVS